MDDYDEEDYGSDAGKGFSDYGGEDGDLGLGEYGDEADEEPRDEGEEEMEQVFAQANENQEMDIVENLRRQADTQEKDFINKDLVKKIE